MCICYVCYVYNTCVRVGVWQVLPSFHRTPLLEGSLPSLRRVWAATTPEVRVGSAASPNPNPLTLTFTTTLTLTPRGTATYPKPYPSSTATYPDPNSTASRLT
jgi:hypothetical protein